MRIDKKNKNNNNNLEAVSLSLAQCSTPGDSLSLGTADDKVLARPRLTADDFHYTLSRLGWPAGVRPADSNYCPASS
ncbi:hypothetical protein RRG08_047285 [Elysia crispata]|uniref:Uncharacterized protein n=1 Tax=Elysia crispata TaxID=231223 RepID=A0AAE0ZC97_9GAST|nr:hypothetical protein RRG08_047285 [Elysia crispata]